MSTTTEPMIGLMRLAWWREALERLDGGPAPAEPLLERLAAEVLPLGVTGKLLSEIEDGWAALLDNDGDAAAVGRHGWGRGRHMFEAAAQILGLADGRLLTAGEVWALADLGVRHSRAPVRDAARARAKDFARLVGRRRWPAAARPLAALYVLALADTRKGVRRQGSPARLLRMLVLRLTGR